MENTIAGSLYHEEAPSRLDEFRSDCLHRKSAVYLIWLAIALLLVVFIFFLLRNKPLGALKPLLFVYYLIVTVHVFYRLNMGGMANILAPDIIFVGFYTMFHFGYITLYALGLAEYSEKAIWFQESIPKSMFIINLGLVGYLFGYEIVEPRQGTLEYSTLKKPTWQWSIVTVWLMILGFVLHIASLFMVGIDTIIAYGYVVIGNIERYSSPRVEMLFWTSNMMMIAGAFIYSIASSLRHGRLFNSKVVLGMIIAISMIFLLEGDRGPFVQMVIPIILIRHYFIKKIPWIFLTAGLIVAFTLMTAISLIRTVVLSPSKMIEEYKYVSGTGQADWKAIFIEAGGSFRVTSIVTNEVPTNAPYWYGQSYISAIIRIVPFLDGVTQRLGLRGPPSYGISPASWVTWTYSGREASGLGFTICTEGYLNFGYPGAFLELMVLGIFIRLLLIKFSKRPSAAWTIIILGCLGASFMIIRNHSLTFTSSCTQIFVVAGCLSFFCKNEQPIEHYETQVSLEQGDQHDYQEIGGSM